MNGRDADPARCLVGAVGVAEAALGGDQDVLGDVLGEMCVAHYAVCDPHDDRVVRPEEPLEPAAQLLGRRPGAVPTLAAILVAL